MTSSHWWQVSQHFRHIKHYSKTLHRWTYCQHNSTLKEDLGPSYHENSVILRMFADETVKKWDNSTWGQVVGTGNRNTRAAKYIQREFQEYLKQVQESWSAMEVYNPRSFVSQGKTDMIDGQKNIHKLIYYLPPSECTGNTIICSIICRYLGCPKAQQ